MIGLELLDSVATTGVLGSITAYLLYRNRELENSLRDALRESTQAINAQAQATVSLAQWLKGRFGNGG